MIKFLREILGYLLIQIHRFGNSKRIGILSIYFHNPSRTLFEKILKWLIAHEYKFISIKELDSIINQKIKTKNLVFISFDDGWERNIELMDLIENFKVPITIFIPTQAVTEGNYWWEYAKIKGQERYTGLTKLIDFKKLSEDIFTEKILILQHNYSLKRSCITLEDLKKINDNNLITIGSHTVTHPILNRCSIETQTFELMESKRTLSSWLDKNVEYLAYPNGDYDKNTIEIAERCGYKLCFTINPGRIEVENVNRYMIPRYAIYDDGGYLENISKILGIWQKIIPQRNK